MGSTSKLAKVEVTVNGSGFDTPSQVSLEETQDVPICDLVFPHGTHSRYRILKRDIVRVYIGLDDVPDIPQFTGHSSNEFGILSTQMSLRGSLNRALKDQRFVTDTDNLDGLEISTAIETVFSQVSELSWMNVLMEATSPTLTVPKDLRYEKGISKYGLMKQLRDLGVNPEDPLELGRYTLFQHGDSIHFRAIPNPTNTNPWVELAYGDSLLDFMPEATTRFSYNKAMTIGKDGVTGEFQNDHRITVDSLSEADILQDTNIPTAGECYEVSRATVLANMVKQNGMDVRSNLLLEATPYLTVIEITGAPYGLSDKYLLRSRNISVSEGEYKVSGRVNIPIDILSNTMSQLLNLSRDYATA